MDEIDAKLKSSCVVGSAVDDGDNVALSCRASQYRQMRQTSTSQQQRRHALLQQQQRKRDEHLSQFRDLVSDTEEGSEEEPMDVVPQAFRYKQIVSSRFRHRLMFSEWMEEVPEDFTANWMMKLCPRGRRCLVVTKKNRQTGMRCTFSYSSGGMQLRAFPSLLPGGCRSRDPARTTILDCIWHQSSNTFHVLDMICWNGHQFDECETEFRFVWLMSKLAEQPGVDVVSSRNPCRFVAVPHHQSTLPQLRSAVQQAADGLQDDTDGLQGDTDGLQGDTDGLQGDTDGLQEAADGLLFYHRMAHYAAGPSPLVLWLKPFMLAETLSVAGEGLPAPPANYPGKAAYIERYERRRASRRRGNNQHE